MSKRILVISSSPRKKGNSDILCDKFIEGATSIGHTVEKIRLNEKKINYCTGCGYCSNTDYNGCVQNDDMNEILDKIIESDVIVLASPMYFYTMCGQMKTFIDRWCAKYTRIKEKEFYYLMTAAETSSSAMDKAIQEFRGLLDCLDEPIERGYLSATGVWAKGDINTTDYPQKAFNLGKSV